MSDETDHPQHGHAEDGRLEPVTGFDYESVERAVFHVEPEELRELSPEATEAGLKLFTALVTWIWQNGMRNPDGMQLRSIIVCWVFLDHLRPLSLTELARAFGKKKQSLGRWVDEFKRSFPNIRNAHMKNESTTRPKAK